MIVPGAPYLDFEMWPSSEARPHSTQATPIIIIRNRSTMPELPDISAYLSALRPRIAGQPLTHIRIASPFLLRTVQPPVEEFEGHTVRSLRRIGKRIAIEFDNGHWLGRHLILPCLVCCPPQLIKPRSALHASA